MVGVLKINRKKRERRLAALLALSEVKRAEVGRCLTDEEMATLVDGSCSDRMREQGWAHLSDCRQCYDQWYSLKMERESARRKNGRLHLMRPRNLAIAGSAMAVAASVAVFLNLPQAPLTNRVVEKTMPSRQLVKESEAPGSPVLEGEVKVDKAIPHSSAPGAVSEQMVLELKEEQPEKSKKRAKPVAAPQPMEKMEAASDVMTAETAEAIADIPRAPSIRRWLEMVQEGCTKRQAEMEFWEHIVLQGDQLFRNIGQGTSKNKEEERAFAVFRLVPRGYSTDSIAGQCEQILAELAEGGKSM